jgi:hypothetical protein
MRQADRDHLVSNVVANARDGVTADVQARVVDCWTNVDAEFGARVAAGLGREMRSAAVTLRLATDGDSLRHRRPQHRRRPRHGTRAPRRRHATRSP